MKGLHTSRVRSSVISDLANGLRCGKYKRVTFLTGAGTSVNAGIPDFRSPGGMYDTLRPELLTATDRQRAIMKTDPTFVVDWELFRVNPIPYMEVRRPFILGLGLSGGSDSNSDGNGEGSSPKWRMTIAHIFQRILYEKSLLHRVFTCNIDGLDYQWSRDMTHDMVANDIDIDIDIDINSRIIAVHGTIGKAVCEYCYNENNFEKFKWKVKNQIKNIYIENDIICGPSESTPILCDSCGKPGVKPATVLYGRSLPQTFFIEQEKLRTQHQTSSSLSSSSSSSSSSSVPVDGECDHDGDNDGDDDDDDGECSLLLILGTSLTVQPSASLPSYMPSKAKRIVFNRNFVTTSDMHYPPPSDTVDTVDTVDTEINISTSSGNTVVVTESTSSNNLDSYVGGDIDMNLLQLIIECGWFDDLWELKDLLCPNSRQMIENENQKMSVKTQTI
jgi:NAD-dependent SIR2 family protein deacetylase